MSTPFRDQNKNRKFGGGGAFKKRSFGGTGFGGRDAERPQMHDAACADCGNRCQVPFRPNGKKPIFCSNCFVREDNGGSTNFGERRTERPRHDDRPSFSRAPSADANAEQFRAINAKLDAILKALGNGSRF